MAVKIRLEPITRDVAVLIADLKTEGAAEVLKEFAQQEIADAKETNRKALGRVPPFSVFVDGHNDEDLSSVQARSTIVAEFELIADVLVWISEQLEQHSPVKSGQYKKSHILLADGIEVQPAAQIQLAEEYVFINVVPYARKIERGASSQAPDGVYQVVATLARRRFGNLARITFSYRTVTEGRIVGGRPGDRAANRNPAVIVRLRS